tara:strand:+ start:456 stop:617 length:162 start_codon:yes stop_codon:yes gene_type:complete
MSSYVFLWLNAHSMIRSAVFLKAPLPAAMRLGAAVRLCAGDMFKITQKVMDGF